MLDPRRVPRSPPPSGPRRGSPRPSHGRWDAAPCRPWRSPSSTSLRRTAVSSIARKACTSMRPSSVASRRCVSTRAVVGGGTLAEMAEVRLEEAGDIAAQRIGDHEEPGGADAVRPVLVLLAPVDRTRRSAWARSCWFQPQLVTAHLDAPADFRDRRRWMLLGIGFGFVAHIALQGSAAAPCYWRARCSRTARRKEEQASRRPRTRCALLGFASSTKHGNAASPLAPRNTLCSDF